MSRIEGLSRSSAGLFARVVYFLTRRRLGKVVKPIAVFAHHSRLLRGIVHMELAHEAARSVDPVIKALVQIRAATLIGCPF